MDTPILNLKPIYTIESQVRYHRITGLKIGIDRIPTFIFAFYFYMKISIWFDRSYIIY